MAHTQSSSSAEDAALLRDPALVAELARTAQLLRLPPSDDGRATLLAALHVLERRFSSSALERASQPESAKESAAAWKNSEHALPLGFDVNDPAVNRAATLLRLLYINDLRSLQTQINTLTSELQQYTAHPTADVKKGRVGK